MTAGRWACKDGNRQVDGQGGSTQASVHCSNRYVGMQVHSRQVGVHGGSRQVGVPSGSMHVFYVLGGSRQVTAVCCLF